MHRGARGGCVSLRAALPLVASLFAGCAIVAELPPRRSDLQPFPPGVDEACAGEQPPRESLRDFVKPQYPLAAFEHGVQGWVCLGFGIDADGAPLDAQVLASAPPGVFDEAALTALRAWRFAPAQGDDGQPRARPGLRLALLFSLDPRTRAEAMGSESSR